MKLFKYRSAFNPSGEENLHTRKMVIEGEIYFANPLDFNDPFDCPTYASLKGRDDDVLAVLEQMSKQRFPEMSDVDVRADARKRLLRYQQDSDFQREFEAQTLSDHHASRGVFCLSEECVSIPMWAHYADQHRGICLEFDLRRIQQAFPPTSKVKYPPAVNAYNAMDTFLSSDEVAVMSLSQSFLTKAPEWEYEQEWRIISDSVGTKNFPKDCLISVILGCRAPKECEELVVSWMRERQTPFAIRRAVANISKMRLDFEDVAISSR
jgi:hypothetical protein